MKNSTVLLISRGTMSGGQMIGECLENHGGIRFLTREHLLAAVNNYGDLATRVTARIEKAAEAYEQFSELRRPYQILMKRALLEYARQGPLAYFGYSGHLLLDRIRHFVRIRLIAPLDQRVARTRQELHYSDEEARSYIREVDQERIRWARWSYGVDIRDPGLYDLSVNIERLSMPGACELLKHVMEHPDFQPTPESIEQAENDRVATEALALLVTDPKTMQMELGATVSQGVLRLVGPFLSEADMEIVRSIAASVPGVGSVEYEPGYAPAFQYSD